MSDNGKLNPKDLKALLTMNFLRTSWLLLAIAILSGCANLPSENAQADDSPYRLEAPRRKSPSLIPKQPLLALSSETPAKNTQVAPIEPPKDLWERIRRGFSMPDLQTDLVDDRVAWYTARPEYMERMTQRGSKYLFHIVEELERRNLPLELALLPYIESAFNPQAVSTAKAAGMWQFMPATGKHFDLKQNAFRDDRRDVLASTRAAMDYLERLYRMFGDWHLALAAYNWGEGNVMRAIQRNEKAGLGTSYNDLRMPNETRYYVPKLQAVKNIVATPERYRTTLPNIGNHPFFDTVTIQRDMDVDLIADLADVTEKEFRQLNPSHTKPVIMAAGTPTVLLPWDNAVLFEQRIKTYQGPFASWTVWQAPRSMSVAELASLHDISEDELRDINKIPPRSLVQAGSAVVVPRPQEHNADIPEHIADSGQILYTSLGAKKAGKIKARRGQTLEALAQQHGVTVAQLRQWNKLGPNAKLRNGQRLIVSLEQAAPVSRSKTAKATSPQRKGSKLSKNTRTASTAKAKAKQKGKKSAVIQAKGKTSTAAR